MGWRAHMQAACSPAAFLLCVPRIALPTIGICFPGFPELSLFSFQAQSSRNVIAGGSSKKKTTGCRNIIGCSDLPQHFIQAFSFLLLSESV